MSKFKVTNRAPARYDGCVTDKELRAFHTPEWMEKFNKAFGDGNTGAMVIEDGKQVFGIYYHDYLRFADVVDYNKSTYFD